MATAADIIKRSLRLIGAIGAGESPTTTETADALLVLNSMIDAWQNESLLLYGQNDYSVTFTPGDGNYTIGPTGNINQTRPLSIYSAYVRDGSSDFQLDIIDGVQWDYILDKTVQSPLPTVLFYDPQYPLGIINVWPVPSAAKVLHVVVSQQITSFATTATALALPPGYQRALEYNLAIELAPEYGRSTPSEVAAIASESKRLIRRTNIPDMALSMPDMFGAAPYNINIE